MKARTWVVLIELLLSASVCFPQASENVQHRFATHSSKAQAFIKENRPDLAIPELQAVVALDADAE
jgi:hypothetical protein